MHLDVTLLPTGIGWLALPAVIAALLWSLWRAPWRALRQRPERVHLVAGGAVACLLLWLLNIHLVDGMTLHLLGITTLTLAIGWCFTLLAGTAMVIGFSVIQSAPWAWNAVAMSVLLTVIAPATVSWILARALYRPRLRHPFVYILGAGFLGGGLVVLAIAALVYALLAWQGLSAMLATAHDFMPLLPLLMFSEGFINGMCVAALAVYYPGALLTFDDAFYLGD